MRGATKGAAARRDVRQPWFVDETRKLMAEFAAGGAQQRREPMSEFDTFITQALERYKAQLQQRHRVLSTRIAREKGAEDFALFLLGKRAKTERVRGALKRGRTVAR